jgi:hypothetical protein
MKGQLMEMETIKQLVDSYGRKKFAAEVGIEYMNLSNKLNGFSKFTEKDMELMNPLLNKLSQSQE